MIYIVYISARRSCTDAIVDWDENKLDVENIVRGYREMQGQ